MNMDLDNNVKKLLQYVAVLILAGTYIICIIIAFIDLLRGVVVPGVVSSVITIGLGSALTLLHVQHGFTLSQQEKQQP